MPSPVSSFEPHWFGEYELLRLLGVGGMAEVYLARTTGAHGFSKLVVVKRILARLRSQQRFVDLFINEAKRVVLLQHANVVQVLGLHEFDGWPFMVMEYVNGKNLLQVLKRAREDKVGLPIDFGVHCLTEMLKGLSYAHGARDTSGSPLNLIHRDITPDNIYVSFEGEVKLGDFGVAHSVGEIGQLEARGKFGYMAPELLDEMPFDQRSDIFSTGVVLWEVLAQRQLFKGKTGPAVLFQVRERMPAPPSQFNPQVPPDLDRIASRALQKDRDKRYQTARELEETLSDYLFARRLRWSRRRIAEVMQARYSDEVGAPALPPPLPKSAAPSDRLSGPIDFADASAEHMVEAMEGAVDAQVSSLPGKSEVGWADPIESDVLDEGAEDADKPLAKPAVPASGVDDGFDEPTVAERILVYMADDPVPAPHSVDELLQIVADLPIGVEGLGALGRALVPSAELGPLLLWDVLGRWPSIPAEVGSTARLSAISLTRLLYEVSARRMNGTLLVEDGSGERQRLLLLRDGLPLYVYSNEGHDGAPPSLYHHQLLEPSALFRCLTRVLSDRKPLDEAMVEVLRGQGQPRAEAVVHGYLTGIIMRRLYPAFHWGDGSYRAYTQRVAEPPYKKPLPPLLGYLVGAARRTYNLNELYELLQGRGENAVVLSPERERHISALNLHADAKKLVESIDGQRSLPQILRGSGATSPADKHRALALFYTLAETRMVELL